MKNLLFHVLHILVLAQVGAQVHSPEWESAYHKARASVARLTLAEKASLTTGLGLFRNTCTGNIAPIPSVGFTGICMQDSALGVSGVVLNSAFPAGINVAATFNRTLMRSRGIAMGQEFRGKGVNVQLGPYMNIMRAPASGRAWEGFGGDPYLSGEAAYETIIGVQSQGVQVVAKHFINNEQEHSRTSSSSDVGDRTQHEVYLHPFLRSVQANAAAVMCSYNMVNSVYACENNSTLNGLLKDELAFRGYVVSDWYATHSTVDAANHGLDVTMPGETFAGSGTSYFGPALMESVLQGRVSESRLNDMATRILAAWYLTGQDDDYPSFKLNQHSNVQDHHASLIREIGAASTILLKNERNTLPLNAPRSIAVIGSAAGANPIGPNSCLDKSCNVGVLAVGWGSGTANFPYLVTPLDAITNRSASDGTTVCSSLSDHDLKAAARAAQGKNAALVFITADSGEDGFLVEDNTGDRNDLQAWHGGDTLVNEVASVNDNTIVVVNTVGPIIVEAWINHPNVTALIWAGLPGQEAGNALADVLYGSYNPSARLPYTIAKAEGDYPARVDYSIHIDTLHIPYSEGLLVDYRHFDKASIVPRFEFGFGLSYTTFEYSALSINGNVSRGNVRKGNGSSIDPHLHETVITASFTLKNTGDVAGHEAPQLYLSPPASANSPPLLLRGFDSVFLIPGESREVSFNISRYALSVWNTLTQRWEIPVGATGVVVGSSSRDLRLTGEIHADN